VAAETVRTKLELEKRTIGEIVYATSDSTEDARARDARLFDRALEAGRIDVDRHVPEAGRVGFEDDFEMVAFDEELRGSRGDSGRIARRSRG
jgi:hypothetical protein